MVEVIGYYVMLDKPVDTGVMTIPDGTVVKIEPVPGDNVNVTVKTVYDEYGDVSLNVPYVDVMGKLIYNTKVSKSVVGNPVGVDGYDSFGFPMVGFVTGDN